MKLELSSLRIKVDLLEAKSIENVDLLTTRILKQEEDQPARTIRVLSSKVKKTLLVIAQL